MVYKCCYFYWLKEDKMGRDGLPKMTLNSRVCVCVCVCVRSVMLDTLQPCGLWPVRLLCPWDSPGKNTGVGHHAFLQGFFPAQGSNPYLLHSLHWQEDSLPLNHPGSQILYQTFKWPQILFRKKTRHKEINSISLPMSLSFLFSFELSSSPAEPLSCESCPFVPRFHDGAS